MKTSILGTVIEAEQEIQARIEAERKKTREWIEQVRAESARAAAGEAERLTGNSASTVAKAKAEAQARAAELVDRAQRRAEQLTALSDARLQQIMARQIHQILPGADRHDRQNVKS